jgi:hypothetical protein
MCVADQRPVLIIHSTKRRTQNGSTTVAVRGRLRGILYNAIALSYLRHQVSRSAALLSLKIRLREPTCSALIWVQSTSPFDISLTPSHCKAGILFIQHQNLFGKLSTMGKKKSFRPKTATSPSRMYPSLHHDVAKAVFEHIGTTRFHENDSDEGSNKSHSTYFMGVFICDNNACPGVAWSSGKITILIRKYPDNGYNAVVFGQRCKSCQKLGRLKLDEKSYIDRVSYRLKKWAGVQMEPPPFDLKGTPPHITELCEGCKRGICAEVF